MSDSFDVLLPDIGDFDEVEIVEVLVSVGDAVEEETSLVVIESDKASMEVPSPVAGSVAALHVAVGDAVREGSRIATIALAETAAAPAGARPDDEAGSAERTPDAAPAAEAVSETPDPAPVDEAVSDTPDAAPAEEAVSETPDAAPVDEAVSETPDPTPVASGVPQLEVGPYSPGSEARPTDAHASPSVRRLARELGVELALVPGSGRKGRVTQQDVQQFVKASLAQGTGGGVPIAGVSVAAAVEVDFSQFGEIDVQPLNRIRRLSSANLHRSWVTVPHVTQFDEADVTGLDAFRREQNARASERDAKLTFLPFVIKAVTAALEAMPHLNASLAPGGEALVLKRYFHIGVAVDTDHGLVVPVVRDANRKGLRELASELADLSDRARRRRLRPEDLQGGSFSISSLGGIGGTFFTPIVNHPEVAILGVSRMDWRPVWRDGEFVPRLLLPLSLSYDHRVIDGADAARFTGLLVDNLSDMRRMLL